MSSFIKPKVFNNLLKVQPKLTIPRKQVVRQYSSRPVVEASNGPTQRKKVTIHTLNNLHKKQIPISMLTAYDYPSGLWVEKSEADICLIGDSLGMVALGYPDTSSVTLEDMIHHSKAAFRGSKTAFRVVDLPMGTYELRPQLALETCFKIIKDTGAEAVKLEGGHEQTGVINTLTQSGVAVVGHIGLTPQRLSQLGGFRIQGKTADNAMRLVEDALAVQESGAIMMILECMPTLVAKMITQHLSIPTIGIGAGAYCSGQVLVTPDAIGMYDRFVPKFCKQYAQITPTVVESLKAYNDEVKKGQFPTDANSYPMAEGEEELFLHKFNQRYLNGGLEFAEL